MSSILTMGHCAASVAPRSGPSDPPLPQSNLPASSGSLKFIALGVGTQNYTCPAGATSPIALGAVATLYNVRGLFKAVPALVEPLPSLALFAQERLGSDASSAINEFTLGRHYFNAAGQPIFDLTEADPPVKLLAKRIAAAPAPAGAYAGAYNEGAVDWLRLNATAIGTSPDTNTQIYRVETAGGKAPVNCTNAGVQIQVKYAAEYWFYGS